MQPLGVTGTVPLSQLVVEILIPFKDAVVVDVDVVAELVAALAELDFIDLAAVVVILVAVEACHIVCCKSCVIQGCLDSCILTGLAGVSVSAEAFCAAATQAGTFIFLDACRTLPPALATS